ncbi:MAG TPA: hypothetical protein VEI07_11540 [Planctomycetaceae bacterium]|nr:hypothetical protein [Planctomycetaceae bacterium]
MAHGIRTWLVAVPLLVLAIPLVRAGEPLRDRRAFAEAMNRIKKGMPEEEAVALVGQPDDVSTDKDWNGALPHTLKILRYGASGHRRAATLGQIWIDDDHRVQYLFGQGTPPPEGMFTEPELRRLLEALNELPGLNGSHYNPRPIIRAVNLLQPLGKKKSLAAIDEFLRVSFQFTEHDAREGLFLVLRTLFEVPSVPTVFPYNIQAKPGYMPPICVGAGSPSEPSDNKLLPRFPIAIEGDIPFFLVEGYNLGGVPEPPESHVAYFRKFGTLRARPLSPAANPVEALEAFEKSPRWYFKKDQPWDIDQRERILLSNQVMNLLDTVYQVEPNSTGTFIGFESEERNKRILLHASKLALRWDTKESKYTFLDGTSLQPPDPNRYSAHFWTPKIGGLKIEFTVKRDSRRYVGLGLEEIYEIGKPGTRADVRVINVKSPKKALFEFQVGGAPDLPADVPPEIRKAMKFPPGTTGSRGTGTTVELVEGEEIRAILVIGEKSFPSPDFKP